MNDVILGLDTSNYKTSAALFSYKDNSWLSRGRFLDVKEGSLGLRQSDALFMHLKALPSVLAELDFEKYRVCAVACSDRPRNVEGSYMPCFLAGESTAKSLSGVLNVPFKSFSHQEGHIASAAFSCGQLNLLKGPFFAWHLSGGTTELLKVTPFENTVKCEICGGTTDISAGQLIDRTGVKLSMPFPSGKYVEEKALLSSNKDFFKVKVNNGYFSLSGVENIINDKITRGESSEDICAYALNTVAYAVLKASNQASLNSALLVSGGVSACSFIKKAFLGKSDVFFAEKGLGGDNALGAALLYALSEDLI